MKNALPLTALMTGFFALTGCAVAPTQPMTAMSPITAYPALDCQGVRNELASIQTWENYYAAEKSYHDKNAGTSSAIGGLGAFVAGMAAAAGDTASLNEATKLNSENARDQAADETRAATAKAQQEGISRRRAALERILTLKNCG